MAIETLDVFRQIFDWYTHFKASRVSAYDEHSEWLISLQKKKKKCSSPHPAKNDHKPKNKNRANKLWSRLNEDSSSKDSSVLAYVIGIIHGILQENLIEIPDSTLYLGI